MHPGEYILSSAEVKKNVTSLWNKPLDVFFSICIFLSTLCLFCFLSTDLESIDFDSYNILVVCQVVKSFFREMPESLLTFDLYGEFLRAVEIPTHREMMFSLQETINKLPEPNFDLFERLIFHLAR